jgi:hypothetical protein
MAHEWQVRVENESERALRHLRFQNEEFSDRRDAILARFSHLVILSEAKNLTYGLAHSQNIGA